MVWVFPIIDVANAGGRLKGYEGRYYDTAAPWHIIETYEAATREDVLDWARRIGADDVDIQPDPSPERLACNERRHRLYLHGKELDELLTGAPSENESAHRHPTPAMQITCQISER
jgi:hypothetical protein